MAPSRTSSVVVPPMQSPVVGSGSTLPRDAASWARCVTSIRLAQAVYRLAENAEADAQTFRSLGVDPDAVTTYMRHSADFCVVETESVVYLAIQGTLRPADALLHHDIQPIPDENGCVLHDGYESYAVRILAKLAMLDLPAIKKAKRLYLSGHGLGGAVAVLLSYLLRASRRPPLVGPDCAIEVATIGAPKCISFFVNEANATHGRPKRPVATEPDRAIARVVEEARGHRHFINVRDVVPHAKLTAFERTGQVYLITRTPQGRTQLFASPPGNILPPLPISVRLFPGLSKHALRHNIPPIMAAGADLAAYFEGNVAPI